MLGITGLLTGPNHERKKEREREVSRGLTAHKVWGDVAAMSIKEDLQEEGDAEGLLGAQ